MHFLRTTIQFPSDLNEALVDSIWGQEPTNAELAALGKTLRPLWEKLALQRGQQERDAHYSFRKEQVDAYSSYYLAANALKPGLILEEALSLGLDLLGDPDSSWLDFGTGPGTAFWGISWWAARRGKKLKFTGWDQSELFAQRAGFLTRKKPFGTEASFLVSEGKRDWSKQIRRLKPTHVSFMNSIAEIFPDEEERLRSVKEIISILRDLEASDGKSRFLVVIEPGSKFSSRELSRMKDALANEGSVLLPCFDNRPCGALVNPEDWCHEECSCEFPSWLNELGSFMRKESMIFSYLVFSPKKGNPLLAGAARMVSQRLEQKGQVECYLCKPEGKRKVRVQRSKTSPENSFFMDACRGDIFSKIELGEKGDILRREVPKIQALPPLF